MYFWRINKLKDHLVQNGLSNFQAFVYFFIYTFFIELSQLPSDEIQASWDKFENLSFFIIGLLGALYCYIKNGGEKGAAFVGRFVSILFVMTIRLIVLLGIPLLIIFYAFNLSRLDHIESAIFLFLNFWFYWRVGYHLRDVARRTTEAPAPPETTPIDSTAMSGS